MRREDFEQLPKIKELIKQYNLFYCKKGDWYLSPNNYIVKVCKKCDKVRVIKVRFC